MSRSRTAGVLWLIAGVSTAGIAFFIVDPVTLGVFIIGAIVGVVLGLAFLFRPSTGLVTWSYVAGVAWLFAFGTITGLNITNPAEEVLSLVWILIFGVLGAATAYRWAHGTGQLGQVRPSFDRRASCQAGGTGSLRPGGSRVGTAYRNRGNRPTGSG